MESLAGVSLQLVVLDSQCGRRGGGSGPLAKTFSERLVKEAEVPSGALNMNIVQAAKKLWVNIAGIRLYLSVCLSLSHLRQIRPLSKNKEYFY